MKIKSRKSDLFKGLQAVQGAVPIRASRPILLNILFEAQKEELKLSATDLEIRITCHICVDTEKEGSIAIPGKLITGILREAPEGEIEITAGNNNTIEIKTGAGSFKVMGLPGDEFPQFPDFDKESSFMIPRNDLYEILKKTLFAALQHTEVKHIFNGVCFLLKNKSLTAVATDGYRLAKIVKPLNIETPEREIIVPLKSVSKLYSILEEDVENVGVFITKNQVMFQIGRVILTSQLTAEKFIEYEKIIPKSFNEKVTVNCDELLSLLKRISLVTTDRFNLANISLSRGTASFGVNTPEVGEAKEDMPVSFDGENLELTLNPDYMIDFLRNVGSARADINIVDKEKPIVLMPSEAGGYIYVIMPIKF